LLWARGRHRELGIVIGAPEALAIELGRTGEQVPRPMTHDFTSALLAALDDVTVLRVVLTERVEGAYRAAFVLRHGDEVVEVDCRPSDAIAVAVRLDVPIVAADPVEALFTAA
jgi:bifunctional DNase/RNase